MRHRTFKEAKEDDSVMRFKHPSPLFDAYEGMSYKGLRLDQLSLDQMSSG